jgi:arginine/serine-rich splicing factor 4/5/6
LKQHSLRAFKNRYYFGAKKSTNHISPIFPKLIGFVTFSTNQMYGDRREEQESERGFRDDRSRAPERQKSTSNVFVGGVAPRTTERTLDEFFSKYGKIDRIVMKNGFSFVEYENQEDALEAVKNLNGIEIDGNKIRVDSSRRGGGDRPSRDGPQDSSKRISPPTQYRVLIEGLAPGTAWQDIKDNLRKVGDVVYVDVYNQTDAPFAVAEFRTEEELKKAIQTIDNTEIAGRVVTLKEDPEKDRPRLYYQKKDRESSRPSYRQDDYRRDEYRGGRDRDDYRRDDYRRDDYRGRDDYPRREEYPRRDNYDDYRRGDRRY